MEDKRTKYQVFSKDGRKIYLCKEFEDAREASDYMSNFIFASRNGAEYIVKIKTV